MRNPHISQLIEHTESVCPQCLRVLDATVSERGGVVYLRKTCPDHGPMKLRIWPDADHYRWLKNFRPPFSKPSCQTPNLLGCPLDCGPCSGHMRQATLVEIEVTHQCNLSCPVCFMAANANRPPANPSLATLNGMFASIAEQNGPDISIQITGGEPTLRRDLPDILRLGAKNGFRWMEVNTNGLVFARNIDFLQACRDAGMSGVYLQFDGLTDDVYRNIRGENLLNDKLRLIENCRSEGIQVVLAMTVIDGINNHQLGDLINFALLNLDTVVGVNLQPAFISGRFEAGQQHRLSMGDVIFSVAEQSKGMLNLHDFWPLSCSHPLCSTATHLLVDEKERVCPVTRLITPEEYRRRFNPKSPQGSVFADIIAELDSQGHTLQGAEMRGLSLMISNYMDAWDMDLKRVRECSMKVKMVDGRAVPFCAYHLNDCNGRRIHAPWGLPLPETIIPPFAV